MTACDSSHGRNTRGDASLWSTRLAPAGIGMLAVIKPNARRPGSLPLFQEPLVRTAFEGRMACTEETLEL